jgi:hypothetical protein
VVEAEDGEAGVRAIKRGENLFVLGKMTMVSDTIQPIRGSGH